MKATSFPRLLSLVLLLWVFTFTACVKHQSDEPENQLLLAGSWTETPQSANYNRSIFFSDDGSFTMHYTSLGATVYAATFNGTYKIEGNKLTVNIKEFIDSQPHLRDIITQVDQQLFDKATFTLKGNELTLNYFTYPADGPVPTQTKFLKN